MAEFTNELYPAILSFLGTSGSEEVTDPELIRVLSKEINKLIRDRGDFVKSRDKNALALQAQVAKNNLEVAKEFAGIQQDLLNIAQKDQLKQMEIMGRLQGAALKAGQAADKRLSPKQSILNAAMQQRTAADKIKYIIGLGITDEKGQRLNDVELYATLEELGRRQNLFTIEKGQVKLGPELSEAKDAETIKNLRTVVRNTAADHAEVVRNREASRKVENDARQRVSELRNDENLTLGVDSVKGTLKLLGQVGFKDVGEATDDVNRIAAELSDSDAQLELYDTEIDSLRDRLDAASGESMDRRYGKIVSSPKFQAWADAYGFRLGSYDADTGKYLEGFDDKKAVLLFAAQQRTGGRLKVRRKGRLVYLTEKSTVPAETREKLDRVAGLEEAKFYTGPGGNGFAVVGEKVFEVKDGRFSEASEKYADMYRSALDPESDVHKEKTPEQIAQFIEGLSADEDTAAQLKSQFTSQILGDSTLEELQQEADEAETGAEVFYREILPHSSDAVRGIRRLQNEETGEIVEVPIETQINIVKDTKGTLGERIRTSREKLAETRAKRQAEQRQRDEGFDPFESAGQSDAKRREKARKELREAEQTLADLNPVETAVEEFELRKARAERLRREALEEESKENPDVDKIQKLRSAADLVEPTSLKLTPEARRALTAVNVLRESMRDAGVEDVPEPADPGYEGELRESGGAIPVEQRGRLARLEEVMARLSKRKGRLESRLERQPEGSKRQETLERKIEDVSELMKATRDRTLQDLKEKRVPLSDPKLRADPPGKVMTAQPLYQGVTFTIEDGGKTLEATANLDERGVHDGSWTVLNVETNTTKSVPAASMERAKIESLIKKSVEKDRKEAGLPPLGDSDFVSSLVRDQVVPTRRGYKRNYVTIRGERARSIDEEETPELKTTGLARLADIVGPESFLGKRITDRLKKRREKAYGTARDADESAFSEPPAPEPPADKPLADKPLADAPSGPRVPFSAEDDEFIIDKQMRAAAQTQREDMRRAAQKLYEKKLKLENSNQTDATGGM